MITREFKLYLNAGVGVAPVINANQFDQSEEWVFTLLQSDGTVYTPSTGAIIGLKQDGTTILNAGTVNSDGQVVITETEQMTAVPGSNLFEILIDGNSHGTANFVVFVERRPGDIDNPSESDISLFQEAITAAGNVTQFQADIAELKSDVDDLEETDTSLASQIAQEASARSQQDAVLQAEIDQIIAPSGEAPSAAEVQNARIGVDGTTYDTLGNAIRGQVGDLKNALNLLGNGLFAIMGNWKNGNIVSSTGGYTTSHAYRIATVDKVTTTKAYDFTIANGFQIYFYLFDAQGNITKKSGWTTGSYSVASGAIYRAVIARTTEDTSEIADVATFKQSVTYDSTIENRLSEAESDISVLEGNIPALTTGVSLAKAEATELGIYGKTLVTVGDIINGNISIAGTPSTSATYKYMVFTSTMLHYLVPLTLTFDAGYSGVVHFYNSATMISANHKSSVSVTNGGSVEIPADSYFAFRMQRYPADTTTDFSPSEASYHVYFKRKGDIVLPSEWLTYIATKEPQIKTSLLNLGSSGISFVFVTDVHIPRNNMLTPQIIQTLKKSVYVDYYINGGDFLDIDTDSSQTALDRLWSWQEAMNGTNEICVRGNHDNNNFNGDNASKAITEGQFYAIFDRPIEKEINTNGKTYFCVDNESQKVRLIFLDNLISGADRNTMYSWMQTKLTELDSSWTILAIEHYIWGSTTETISTQGQLTIDAINAVYSNINAEFIGILAGHTHVDNNSTESVNGYHLIARDTNMISRGTGTNTLSFDYVTINTSAKTINFTKIGRGSDLSLSY